MNARRPLVIDAANIAPGGTLVLLEALYAAARARGMEVRLLVRSALKGRFADGDAEGYDRFPVGRAKRLRDMIDASGAHTVLHFGNLATALPLAGVRQVVYFHNLNIVHPAGGGANGVGQRLKNHAMATWMRRTRGHVARVYVQTSLVAEALQRTMGYHDGQVAVRPFYGFRAPTAPDLAAATPFDLVYPAHYYAHKNHGALLEALGLLASERGLRPSVGLISDRDPRLEADVAACNSRGANVTRIGPMDHHEVLATLARSGALVFPSLLESYGLPLLEAALLSRPVLCSELPYAHAVIAPSKTFNPHLVESIVSAIEEYLRLGAPPATLKSYDRTHQLLADLDDHASSLSSQSGCYPA